MRQKRAKAYKRLMSLYSQTFGFRQPFQVLVAHDFLLELANKQLDVSKQLTNCVQGECKPMITQCSVDALYKLGKDAQSVVDIAKKFERRRCNHREALPEYDCITEVVGSTNKHRYTMAIQSSRLRNNLRRIPGIPIIHFNERSVMVLEMPSDATLKHKDQLERTKLTAQLETHPITDDANVITSSSSTPGAGPSDAKVRSRKAGPKAPNPLSVSKKGSEKQTGRLSKKELEERAARLERKREAKEKRAEAKEAESDDGEGNKASSGSEEAVTGKKRKRGSEAAEQDSDREAGSDDHAWNTKPADQSVLTERNAQTGAPVKDTPEIAHDVVDPQRRKRKRKRKGASASTSAAGAAAPAEDNSGDEA